MRQTGRWLQCFHATGLLRLTVPRSPKEEEEHFKRMREEATATGIGRRDGGDDKVFMDKTFHQRESVDGIAVANLPAKAKVETAFDRYERSSTEFTSIVSPHRTEPSALGAGFGAKPDKRLGFLRPKQTLQPFTGAVSSVVPKYDENGMPVDDTLSADQRMKKRMEYLRSIEGTTMSRNEHFLLADLDFEKDAVLFGNTREEFEKNVTKLKNVILSYNKWERTDNAYYYFTILLKLTVVWVLIECVQQYHDLRLFEKNYETFADVMEKEMIELVEKREKDFATAREQLRVGKPDFSPVIAAMLQERNRVQESEAVQRRAAPRQPEVAANPSITAAQLLSQLPQEDSESDTKGSHTATPPTNSGTPTALLALERSTQHPMDTMGDREYSKRMEAEERHREMRRLYEHTAKPEHFKLISTVWRKLRGSENATLSQPLQQGDFARFSYAASPTSVVALRAIRRTLLPRSEDYTQVVREEMLEHKRQKETFAAAPSP